ncbi:hypothetical protein SODALDRAFT_296570 [Sodiomyces alkalinus F11]|uniref:Squalene/phytoene synthase n=1 Tax=Sodiomyces alkalinus (strain CBS 110278 / VKM F-3762 / F11) TaxID=1314773 RepID=A0A3N2PU91_SODAK|nr:hypothetical protein SODALDRAFT_296570 [Sodiomyces alkalinus F11]ROT38070.1 hypothetical protein SODALDRAFT_296570 [Sodiomyces alkalinus F11]
MYRPRLVSHGLRRLPQAPRLGIRARGIVTDADADKARNYCLSHVKQGDYDGYLIQRFVPSRVRDTYLALRALNLELVRLPDIVSNPTIGHMRMQFWRESIDKTFAGAPPSEPICILLHQALEGLRARSPSGATASSVKFWIQRFIKTRQRHMDNRPFASLASLEDYGEQTYATLMYATLAALPINSMHMDHLASHVGKAHGIVAVLRGIPVLAAPQQAVRSPDGATQVGRGRDPVLLLPLDVMADANVREEDVFRQGPGAEGFQDAVFTVATRANDHLITARDMLKKLKAGEGPGHDFEHQAEAGHVYDHETDVARDIRRGFGLLLEAVPAQEYLANLEGCNFNPFAVRPGWKLPWRIWQALRKEQI